MQCKMWRYVVNGGVVCPGRQAGKQKSAEWWALLASGVGQAIARSMQKEPRARTLES